MLHVTKNNLDTGLPDYEVINTVMPQSVHVNKAMCIIFPVH